MRVTPDEYARLELRAHSFLSDVPLHDVWSVDLHGRRSGRGMADLREVLAGKSLTKANPAVSFLFGLRAWLGRIFGWDKGPPAASDRSFIDRLTASDVASSLVKPGTPEGPFCVLFASPREAISEVRNSTVHGFSVFALVENTGGFRLFWAIHIRPVGRITSMYMQLIDPFRRFIIYPSILRHIREAWSREASAPEA